MPSYRYSAPFALAATIFAFVAVAGEPATRKVWADQDTNLLGGPSPDGKLLSYVDPSTGNLAVRDLVTGQFRHLTNNPSGAKTFAYFSAFSRDSSSLAYAWFNEEGFYELWTVPADGGKPRQLYSNPEIGFVQPCDWALDGSHILTLFFRKDNVSQIALVSAEDGSVRILKTLSWFYPKKISFSPDGKYVLYDSLTGRDDVARDILLLNADGSGERKLIEHKANDIFPLWTPAGDAVVFASDRSGDMDLWTAPVADGELAGAPRPIARSFGRALPLGITRSGVYYFGLRSGTSDVYTASLHGASLREPDPIGLATRGRNSGPAWSHDGKRIAYLTRLGTENYGRQSQGIAVWNAAARTESLLKPPLAYVSRLRWSPGDATILAQGSDGRGRSGLFAVAPDTGEVEGLVRIPGGDPGGLEGVWLSPGNLIYISADHSQIISRSPADGEETVLYGAEPEERLHHLASSPSGNRIAFSSGAKDDARQVHTLSLDARDEPRSYPLPTGSITAIEWAPDALYVTAMGTRNAAVWRLPPQAQGLVKTSLQAPATGIRVSPDGSKAAYTQSDERSEVWALENWLE